MQNSECLLDSHPRQEEIFGPVLPVIPYDRFEPLETSDSCHRASSSGSSATSQLLQADVLMLCLSEGCLGDDQEAGDPIGLLHFLRKFSPPARTVGILLACWGSQGVPFRPGI